MGARHLYLRIFHYMLLYIHCTTFQWKRLYCTTFVWHFLALVTQEGYFILRTVKLQFIEACTLGFLLPLENKLTYCHCAICILLQRVNPTDFDDPLTSPLAPAWSDISGLVWISQLLSNQNVGTHIYIYHNHRMNCDKFCSSGEL